jgi:hypothetical protein
MNSRVADTFADGRTADILVIIAQNGLKSAFAFAKFTLYPNISVSATLPGYSLPAPAVLR